MKRIIFSTALLVIAIFGMQSCTKDTCTREWRYFINEPVWRTKDQIRQPIDVEGARTLQNPGKIYVFGDYLFINELFEGVHIIDNSDPSNPQPISFIAIPGNVDIAVQDNILYADNYIDLVTIDIADPTQATMVSRTMDVFPPVYTDQDSNLLVGYRPIEMVEFVQCDQWGNRWGRANVFASFDMAATGTANQSSTGGGSGGGTGGSMARFTITQGHLYTVDDNYLRVFDIATPENPNKVNDIYAGWGIETIFPYQDKLFLGSSNGMYIFENATPSAPYQLSRFAHARACDPVFVKDNYAYVTLRSGTWCEGFTNQLDVIDITSLTSPRLEETFEMDNPHGLSILNNELYLCEGDKGLKVFDIADPLKLDKNKIEHIKDFDAYDVITLGNKNVAIVVGKDGLYQYDISNPNSLQELSKIEVNN